MFVSFYSYKGGVGRTQLLANAASYLCFYKHKKVLLLEWDLEAPGLHYYFGKKNTEISQEGLIELLEKYMSLAHRGTKLHSKDLPFFTEENIVKNLIVSKNGQGRVDLIPCANYTNPDFTQKINDFDWREFMEMRDGNVFIDYLKTKLKELKYDYVFIDSRTGISDYSGLCNILLPDVNVIVVAPTDQNFEGALRITKAIAEHPYLMEGSRKPFILPILSRIDNSISNSYEKWVERFENEFGFVCEVLLDDKLKTFKTQVFRDLYVPQTTLLYNREVALGENKLFDQQARAKSELSLAKNYENIANYIDRLNQEPHLNFYGEITQTLLDKWLDENNTISHHIDISDIYEEMGNLQKAKETAEKGLYLAQKEDDQYNIGLFYQRLGDIESSLGNLEKALEYFKKDNQLSAKLFAQNPTKENYKNGLAISYEKLGEIQSRLGNLKGALEYFEKYNDLEKELYAAYPNNVEFKNNLAISYSKLGGTQNSLRKLEKTLEYFEKYNDLEKELYAAYPTNVSFKNSLAISYSKLGDTYKTLRKLEKALDFYQQENIIVKELCESYPTNVSFKNGLAISYSKLGETQSSLGNLKGALEYFEKDLELTKELYAAYPTNVSFKNDLAISYSKLGDTQSSLGNLARALKYFEICNQLGNELYAAYPTNVNFKNGLAISYSKLGSFYKNSDKQKAKMYYLECKKHYLELTKSFPAYVEFQENLQWVENRLAGL